MNDATIAISIRPFQPGDAAVFRSLNEEWIRRFFGMEAEDEHLLSDPERSILSRGGIILFAMDGERAVGCGALIPHGEREFEVGKMAVSPELRGGGIGRKLMLALIEKGREAGAQRLSLETNHVLENAIHLYEAVGFRHIPQERVVASPYARADVFMEMLL